jgi:N,N'-diacetyllegionaminate synthase
LEIPAKFRILDKVLIIAEAGVNHNGDLNTAKHLIDVAAEAGADFVKFQTFKANRLVSSSASKADYQKKNEIGKYESQYEMLKKLELSEDDHYVLIDYCNNRGIKFLSTAFDLESLDFLLKLGMTLFKVPSGELTNLPYLEKISKISKHIILSTGMSTMNEIKNAVSVLKENPDAEIIVLHCNTEYPTPFHDVNLLAMNLIKEQLNLEVGYSDHTMGIEVPIAAVAMGARVIEKHFTLDRSMKGPDHSASLEPSELRDMVRAIRNIEIALGEKSKKPSKSESKNLQVARKSIHLATDKGIGEILIEEDFEMLRPGDGISPMEMRTLVGKRVNKNLLVGHKITWKDFDL